MKKILTLFCLALMVVASGAVSVLAEEGGTTEVTFTVEEPDYYDMSIPDADVTYTLTIPSTIALTTDNMTNDYYTADVTEYFSINNVVGNFGDVVGLTFDGSKNEMHLVNSANTNYKLPYKMYMGFGAASETPGGVKEFNSENYSSQLSDLKSRNKENFDSVFIRTGYIDVSNTIYDQQWTFMVGLAVGDAKSAKPGSYSDILTFSVDTFNSRPRLEFTDESGNVILRLDEHEDRVYGSDDNIQQFLEGIQSINKGIRFNSKYYKSDVSSKMDVDIYFINDSGEKRLLNLVSTATKTAYSLTDMDTLDLIESGELKYKAGEFDSLVSFGSNGEDVSIYPNTGYMRGSGRLFVLVAD